MPELPPPRLVVGAAIVRGARVLAARRTTPPAAAGRWELPGGKVEPGEPPAAAVEREVDEELGCEVEVVAWLDGTSRIREATDDGPALDLRVALARVVGGEPEPTDEPGGHDQVRWLAAEELDEVDWLDSDRPFLPQLRHHLARVAADQRRLVLFEEEDAIAVQQRLVADGFDAVLTRERLAGEDDDEDHPWAVLTDAPTFVVELLLDEVDGWLDEGDQPGAGEQAGPRAGWTPTAPPALPTAPKRVKRPDRA
ncbi:(deoxy)nucleoside triphosphate pyrophosphohydrolase [Nocardioides bruguierae]|uniref:(deoxy)nucleoside triphosphate pyrophosphohydrolase n=1 Tax=Nocardioides bruguierae TaxID=2945102 RepID=UPI0020207A7A|nr:(deoxy)nucleoside triphosphate pyrophosphohydrolase [Nocardioides bruguierae]MCL8025719.1 (deoxy)nucleoside triphosphate pyrophosphohydrolase [Nocardioides bruguierae]